MEKLVKFGLYDQLGYLFVGALAEAVIFLDVLIRDRNVTLPQGTLFTAVFMVVGAYFLGHFCQAVANLVFREKPTDFTDKEKKILQRIIKKYDLAKDDYREAFAVCMAFTKWKDVTGEVAAFNANYGLYRGWKVVASMNVVYGLGLAILSSDKTEFRNGLLTAVVSLVVAVILSIRAKRFYKYTGKKVLLTYQLLEIKD